MVEERVYQDCYAELTEGGIFGPCVQGFTTSEAVYCVGFVENYESLEKEK